jgi:hypothetical protein
MVADCRDYAVGLKRAKRAARRPKFIPWAEVIASPVASHKHGRRSRVWPRTYDRWLLGSDIITNSEWPTIQIFMHHASRDDNSCPRDSAAISAVPEICAAPDLSCGESPETLSNCRPGEMDQRL